VATAELVQASRRRPAWGKIVAAALIMAALAAAWRFSPLADYLTPHRLAGWARAARRTPWAPIALVVAYTPAAFVLFPRPLLTLIAVIAFGAWLGLLYAVAGILGAALATYCVGRFMRRETVRRIVGDTLDDAAQIFRGHAVVGVFAANMVPVPPFGVQGMLAGAMRLNVLQYSLGTLLSILPGAVLLAFFGRQITAGLEGSGPVSYWLLGLPLVGVAIFAFLGRRWAQRRSQR
jgi:phospholipase D1/2